MRSVIDIIRDHYSDAVRHASVRARQECAMREAFTLQCSSVDDDTRKRCRYVPRRAF